MSNALRDVRPVFEKTLRKALDELERSWGDDSTKAAPARFRFTLEVQLVNGQRIVCSPEGDMYAQDSEPA